MRRKNRRWILVLAGFWLGALRIQAEETLPVPTIDFARVGYRASEVPLPRVPAVIRVQASGADDTGLLQAAIDHVGALPIQENGFRGAILLDGANGSFHVEGQLQVRTGGVVLRGTVEPVVEIIATGQGRRTLIQIGREEEPALATAIPVTDELVRADSVTLTLSSVAGFMPGDRVVITRPSTKEWIAALGMDQAPGNFADIRTHWLPGSRDLTWDRFVLAVDAAAQTITVDAPITTALERRYGGGTVAKVTGREPPRNFGVEDLELRTAAKSPDEEHAWIAVAVNHVEDVFVSGIVTRGFAGSAVRVGPRARRVTVWSCYNEAFASELGGYRRQSYLVEGQQVLVADCQSEGGLNDFAVGHCAAGPNVFRDCTASHALGPSGSFESWASGVLYDRVHIDGAGLRLVRDDSRAQGAGWTAANAFVRECTATEIAVQSPPGADVLVVDPASREDPLPRISGEGRSAIEAPADVPLFSPPPAATAAARARQPLTIEGGRFVAGGRVVWGGQLNAAWWKGQISAPIAVAATGRSITRFVPGRDGPGRTEILPELAADLESLGQPFYSGGPGLWYDRRRDDHLTIARTDANVWAPFYELPWARSGQGVAFDGLSQYDLTKFNPWYFDRMREWAQLCTEHGLVFTVSLYNTHNMLETLAHYADYPWRPANNRNDTGLPEPPPLDAHNTIHLAAQIYDTTDPRRRALHRALIRHHLEVLGDQPNVIFSVAFQFAGPLRFQEFFLDTVAEWERETGRQVKLALVTSKDVTDAILAEPQRAAQINVIDLRYWQKLADGSMWAPRGDRNLAFREQNTEQFGRGVDTPPDTKPLFVYQQVREYRDRYPDKAIVAWNGGCGPMPVLMAGGAQALMRNPAAGQTQGAADRLSFDAFVRENLGDVLPAMFPRDGLLVDPDNTWCLADASGRHVLIASLAGANVVLSDRASSLFGTQSQTGPMSDSHEYTGVWFNPATGESRALQDPLKWSAGLKVPKPIGDGMLYLRLRPATPPRSGG